MRGITTWGILCNGSGVSFKVPSVAWCFVFFCIVSCLCGNAKGESYHCQGLRGLAKSFAGPDEVQFCCDPLDLLRGSFGHFGPKVDNISRMGPDASLLQKRIWGSLSRFPPRVFCTSAAPECTGVKL